MVRINPPGEQRLLPADPTDLGVDPQDGVGNNNPQTPVDLARRQNASNEPSPLILYDHKSIYDGGGGWSSFGCFGSAPPPTDLGVVPHDLIGAALGVDPPHRREREARGPETRSPAHRPVSESPTVRSDTQVYLQTETLPTYLTYIKFHHPFQTSLPGLSRQGPFQPIPPQNWARQTAASAKMGTLSGSRVPLPFSSSPSGHHLLPLPSVRPSLSCRVTTLTP